MAKTALLLGSIGSVMETSDIQRSSYNQAMSEAGLDWTWDRETYADLLKQAGGKERLAHLSAATNAGLSSDQIEAIHQRKTELACAQLASGAAALRPGVLDLVKQAKERGMKIGFVTTTYRPNIDAVFAAAGGSLSEDDFDVIVTRDDVDGGKPAPDAYHAALKSLGDRGQGRACDRGHRKQRHVRKARGYRRRCDPRRDHGGSGFLAGRPGSFRRLPVDDGVDRRVMALLD